MTIIAFSAHQNYVKQTGFDPGPPNPDGGFYGTYNKVFFGATSEAGLHTGYNVGNRYDTVTSEFTPVITGEEPALVTFSGQLWIPQGGISGQNYVGRVVKNGWPAGQSITAQIATKGPFPQDWVISLATQDVAYPGDSYSVWLFTKNASMVLDAHPLHTNFKASVEGGGSQ